MKHIEDKMGKIKVAQAEYKKCKKDRDKLVEPIIKDRRYIQLIHSWCYEYDPISMDKMTKHEVSVRQKNIFTFIIIYLYSPIRFVKTRTENGIRKELTKLFGITADNSISGHIKNSIEQFKFYSDYREDIYKRYELIYNRLVEAGIIIPND